VPPLSLQKMKVKHVIRIFIVGTLVVCGLKAVHLLLAEAQSASYSNSERSATKRIEDEPNNSLNKVGCCSGDFGGTKNHGHQKGIKSVNVQLRTTGVKH